MRRSLVLVLLLNMVSATVRQGPASGRTDSSEGIPIRSAPQKLIEAWLRFHEMDLCQGLDAVFVWEKSGMEVWCLIEDERSYQKLQELLDPLRGSYRIELYATRKPAEKRSDEEDGPPASLWENYELRSYLGDPFAQVRQRLGADLAMPSRMDLSPDSLAVDALKERLLLYAEQTLGWNQKIKKYAMDLPGLVRVALDPAAAPGLRSQAEAACMTHAQNLVKTLGKLESNLIPAFPKSTKREPAPSRPTRSAGAVGALMDCAVEISDSGQNVARRVYRFIHPEHYTVDLDELRQPSLLGALRDLEATALDFEKSLAKLAPK